MKTLSLFLFLLLLGHVAYAQEHLNSVAFNSPRWNVTAKDTASEQYLGKAALRVAGGSLILKDAAFKNGIIEFDIALPQARLFPGIAFRMADACNTELYYLRPHQSGNPDAMQYYPVYNGADNWQLYYGQGFNNPHVLPVEKWLHIRLVVKDQQAEVYFDQEPEPVLFIARLQRPIQSGMIALQNTGTVPVHFANFSYLGTDNVTLHSKPLQAAPLSPDVIRRWQVSKPFDEALVKDKVRLTPADTGKLEWQTLRTDERGIADLSSLAGAVKGKNAVFVRTSIRSDAAAIKKFTFGFSDRAQVYLNGKLLYAGADEYMSRDYRFLGTIGFFDSVYLPLQKGKNNLLIVVAETMGGWGIEGKLENTQKSDQ